MLLGSRKQKHEHKELRNSLIVAFIWSYGDLKAEKIIFAIWKANSSGPGQIQLTYICNIQLHLLNPGHNTAKFTEYPNKNNETEIDENTSKQLR